MADVWVDEAQEVPQLYLVERIQVAPVPRPDDLPHQSVSVCAAQVAAQIAELLRKGANTTLLRELRELDEENDDEDQGDLERDEEDERLG
eukprot:210791-Prymnesium_polylepis.1